jgi:hypothetical protein
MAIPTRPTQDGLIDPTWGQWVHDHEVTPKRFALWRVTDTPLTVDGTNPITYEQKEDVGGLTSGSSAFKAPAAGLLVVSISVTISLSGPAGNISLLSQLMLGAAELRRGNQWSSPASGMPSTFSSIISAVVPVAANDTLTVNAFAQGPGITKNLRGQRIYQYFEGVYLTAT